MGSNEWCASNLKSHPTNVIRIEKWWTFEQRTGLTDPQLRIDFDGNRHHPVGLQVEQLASISGPTWVDSTAPGNLYGRPCAHVGVGADPDLH